MSKVIEKYNEYCGCSNETWVSRFTWGGLDGKTPKHRTSIIKFNKDTDAFAKMPIACNTNELLNEVKKMAKTYVDWVKSKDSSYTKLECEDMLRFFQGAIGEYFFFCLFEDVRCILAPDNGGVICRYDFNFMSPTLKSENDMGVDLYGFVNDAQSVIQVKFWNPWTNHGVSVATIQKAYAEGISNDIIDKEEKNNVFICFLGNESGIYDKIRSTGYRNNVVAIGKVALKYTIDDRNTIFWNKFHDRLVNFK